MKIKKLSLTLAIFLLLTAFKPATKSEIVQSNWVRKGIDRAQFQLKAMAKTIEGMKPDSAIFPRSYSKEEKMKWAGKHDWTSGFYPGSLWYAYELTGDSSIGVYARKFTNQLNSIQFYRGNHDVGFMMYCSYGNAIRLKPQATDELVLVNTAKSLASRFSPVTKTIRSWDFGTWSYPVIIDNMMNLELLYWASNDTKDEKYKNIAIQHADATIKNHFRKDFSSYHVVSFDAATGGVESKETHQGFSDLSAWARGQAWGLYGFTFSYRETREQRYLDQAKAIASFIMNNPATPADLIPYWDYNAPDIPKSPRDASAAAITASALLELSKLVPDGKPYFNYAEKILKTLSGDEYLAQKGENNGFILMHSVGSFPHNSEVNAPIIYADYYYLEGLKKYLEIINKNKTSF